MLLPPPSPPQRTADAPTNPWAQAKPSYHSFTLDGRHLDADTSEAAAVLRVVVLLGLPKAGTAVAQPRRFTVPPCDVSA